MPILRLAFDRTARRIDADGRLHVDRSHKVCAECGENRPVESFSKRAKSPDGLQGKCKACSASAKKKWLTENVEHVREYAQKYDATYRENNKEQIAEKKREYHQQNAARLIAKVAFWQRENKSRVNAKNSTWRKANRDVCNAKSARRRATKFKATPAWANQTAIRRIYENAPSGYDVDHVVPLNSPLVCGLHVENNLQIVPALENRVKGNKFWPDMP